MYLFWLFGEEYFGALKNESLSSKRKRSRSPKSVIMLMYVVKILPRSLSGSNKTNISQLVMSITTLRNWT